MAPGEEGWKAQTNPQSHVFSSANSALIFVYFSPF